MTLWVHVKYPTNQWKMENQKNWISQLYQQVHFEQASFTAAGQLTFHISLPPPDGGLNPVLSAVALALS